MCWARRFRGYNDSFKSIKNMENRTLQKIINFDISRKAALCTQVEWSGSVPRKDFPMMLVDEQGEIIGTVGGGALEHSVIETSKSIIKTDKPVIKHFDLTNQDVALAGSVCGGNTTILIEPFTNDIRKIFKSILNNKVLNNNILITSIFSNENIQISRKRITKDYQLAFPKIVVKNIEDVIKQKNSKSIKIKDEYYLIQYIGNKPTLHIFGAGHVGQAVADLANFIELNTIIYDDRKELATIERFPYAMELINSEVSETIKNSKINSYDYVLVATRGHQHDFELMQWLLTLKIDYLSLMSSKRKWQLLSEALIKQGFTQEKIQSVYSPVGLDIGSETVPEIAASIIAEIVNHYRNTKQLSISLSKNYE